MNSSDLADLIGGAHGLSKADAKKIVDGVFAAISDAAAKGEENSIPGLQPSVAVSQLRPSACH